ncbi:MAG: hybrid sensor histidine kinase/response regulator [Desulfuromonadales bacterium]
MHKDETKYRVFFENSADAMLIIKNGEFVDCNSAAVTMLSYDEKEELINMPPFMLSPEFQPDGRSSFDKAVEMMQMARDKGSHRFEWDHLRKNGSIIPVEVSLTAIESEDDEQLHTVWRDISKRKWAEKNLLESKEKYKQIFDHLQEVYYETSLNGTILEFSSSIESLTYYTREELIGKSILDIYVDTKERDDLLKLVLEKEKIKDYKIHLKDRTGLQHLCLITVMLMRDSQDIPVKLIGSIRDISEIERTQELLRIQIKEYETSQRLLKESEERFKALNEASFGGVFIYAKGLIMDCNQRLSDITGFSREELVGMRGIKLVAPDWHGLMKRNVKRSYDWSYEVEGVHKDGSIYPLMIRGKKVTYKQHKALLVEFRDITERKRVEAEHQKLEKLESIGTLAGGIAHDFNNILTGLYGNVALAKMKLASDHPGFRFLETAEKSMDKATFLTNQLLTFAKGGAPVMESLSLGSLVEDVVNFNLSGSDVKPVISLADNLWMAKVDQGQIKQVFATLTINARQAMPDGGHLYVTIENTEISVNVIRGLDRGKYLHITVTDEGTGIAPEHLDRLFDLYFTTKQMGSGLGLATTYSIINKHKGHISVISPPGEGTTFTLYLPATAVTETSSRQTLATSSSLGQTFRVLVMDDEEMIRSLLRDLLRELGFAVETAAEGRQAIELYRQAMDKGESFAVVILDLTIPGGMGGQKTAKEILQMDPEAKIIVSSGYADDPVMASYADYGFKGVASKPYSPRKLSDVLGQLLVNS